MSNEEPIKILFSTVADTCGIEKKDMLNPEIKTHKYILPRWLWWFGVKNLTNLDNQTIGGITFSDKKFESYKVQYGIKKMSYMVDNDYIWSRRWSAIKKVIKDIKKDFEQERETKKVTIIVPKGIEVEIKEK